MTSRMFVFYKELGEKKETEAFCERELAKDKILATY